MGKRLRTIRVYPFLTVLAEPLTPSSCVTSTPRDNAVTNLSIRWSELLPTGSSTLTDSKTFQKLPRSYAKTTKLRTSRRTVASTTCLASTSQSTPTTSTDELNEAQRSKHKSNVSFFIFAHIYK